MNGWSGHTPPHPLIPKDPVWWRSAYISLCALCLFGCRWVLNYRLTASPLYICFDIEHGAGRDTLIEVLRSVLFIFRSIVTFKISSKLHLFHPGSRKCSPMSLLCHGYLIGMELTVGFASLPTIARMYQIPTVTSHHHTLILFSSLSLSREFANSAQPGFQFQFPMHGTPMFYWSDGSHTFSHKGTLCPWEPVCQRPKSLPRLRVHPMFAWCEKSWLQ